ncbi:STAS/SEC14 domain-containing protein [Bartonella sp. W8122]|uniref:STAS/SEC14 domain-containing protein n=1 Tax=Bartonella TaxID=773 RepID=UPI0018DDDB1D|nr:MULTISPECIES: STAS/SEC14 domain-containing protein [Bartonella]MBH9994105.1 STAS/SEC14 domain-containing protein [Bartonella sp. P0291]MBH9997550.1 STAS/SEC14 domain-containing protein [Bartonella sp. M0192]MBH9999710.1 STAS/SEC14 domain-containing protein [Bartonella sp. M0191]MBI0001877.1 STAS/SEC14 domain-containing protein [Bartonella sp. W8122]MBI0008653.1 STAS/SEC14 domain-containing protein [Bartonella sp. M0193]
MLPEDTIPVISKIKTNRAGAIGFSVNGVLASSDVENLYGLFEAEAEGQNHIDMIVIFKEYDGIDWESLFNEDTAKIRAEAFKKLRRYAIVGGPSWLNLAIEFFRPFGRIETKWFASENIDKAWDYIGAKPV